MKVTLNFDCGDLGDVEIETDSNHGNPDRVLVNGKDYSKNGTVVQFIVEAIGERAYQDAVSEAALNYPQMRAEERGDEQRDLQIDREMEKGA